MRKCLVFILALTLVLGSFGFSFACVVGDAGADLGPGISQGQGGQEQGVQGSGDQGQGNEGQGAQGSGDQGQGNEGPGNEGSGNQDTGNQGPGNQDFTPKMQSLRCVPTYPVSYTINKEITIESGMPDDEDFDFNINIYKWSLSKVKWVKAGSEEVSLHVTAGALAASVPVEIGDFNWYDFPIKVKITEVDGSVEGWSYDDQGYKAIIGLVDAPLLTAWIPNYVAYENCTWPKDITFSNTFNGPDSPPTCVTPGSIEISKSIDTENKGSITEFYFDVLDENEVVVRDNVAVSAGGFITVSGLTPGAYTVTEVEIPVGYTAAEESMEVTVPSDGAATAAFVNSYEEPIVPPVSEAAISLIKQVATSEEGPWSDEVTVDSKNSTVYYRFIVKNTGDYDFASVKIDDSYISLADYLLGPLEIGFTATSEALEYVLTDESSWDGNTFTNTATATGCTSGDITPCQCAARIMIDDSEQIQCCLEPEENICCTDTDSAIVTYKEESDDKPNGGGRTGRTTTVIPEPEIPLVEDPGTEIVEISIPDAAIPQTGGLGFGLFMLVGGTLTAFGVRLRKKDEE